MNEFKLLTIEETNALVRDAKEGDEEAKSKLLESNFPLIKSIIKSYQNKGVEYDDLYQIGCVGFLKAINNFDEKFGVKFSTYAVPMIAGEIKRFLRDDGSVKISRTIKSLWLKLKVYLDEVNKTSGASLTTNELAEKFGVEPSDIIVAMDSAQAIISLNAQLDDSSSSIAVIDKIACDDKSEQLLDKILLKQAIANLPDREKKILLLRYFRGKTQSEVAQMLGISQVQVSRIETKIIDKLKAKIN